MQTLDGVFQKIGGASNWSAGGAEEEGKQPWEVLKCKNIQNQASMEIGHQETAQALWGSQDQWTADVGQAGRMEAFFHLFGGLPHLKSPLPTAVGLGPDPSVTLNVRVQPQDISHGGQWHNTKAVVPNNMTNMWRDFQANTDAVETGLVHQAPCSQPLLRGELNGASQVGGSQGMEVYSQLKQQMYLNASSNCETACISSCPMPDSSKGTSLGTDMNSMHKEHLTLQHQQRHLSSSEEWPSFAQSCGQSEAQGKGSSTYVTSVLEQQWLHDRIIDLSLLSSHYLQGEGQKWGQQLAMSTQDFPGFQAQHCVPGLQELENCQYGQWPGLSKFSANSGAMAATSHMQQQQNLQDRHCLISQADFNLGEFRTNAPGGDGSQIQAVGLYEETQIANGFRQSQSAQMWRKI
jgi:hypothetical protein